MLNEARREVKIQSALRLITRGKFSDEDIAGVTELTLEEVFLKITTGDIYGNVADSVDKLKFTK